VFTESLNKDSRRVFTESLNKDSRRLFTESLNKEEERVYRKLEQRGGTCLLIESLNREKQEGAYRKLSKR
jgi:hypothetical protein